VILLTVVFNDDCPWWVALQLHKQKPALILPPLILKEKKNGKEQQHKIQVLAPFTVQQPIPALQYSEKVNYSESSRVSMSQSSHKCPFSLPVRIHDSNLTYFLMSFQ